MVNMTETAKKRGRPPIQDADYNAARARKMEADAQLAELELLKAKRELVSSADVRGAWVDVLGAMRGKLLSLPTKLAPLLSTEDQIGVIQHLIEEGIREALDELSAYQPDVDAGNAAITGHGDSRSDGGVEATTATKRQRVGRPRKASVIGK